MENMFVIYCSPVSGNHDRPFRHALSNILGWNYQWEIEIKSFPNHLVICSLFFLLVCLSKIQWNTQPRFVFIISTPHLYHRQRLVHILQNTYSNTDKLFTFAVYCTKLLKLEARLRWFFTRLPIFSRNILKLCDDAHLLNQHYRFLQFKS